MSDEYESMGVPDELRDIASRLRGVRPVASQANEAECMYRAGWQAALAAGSAPESLGASSWQKSYFGGMLSGALVSGVLAAAWLLGMTKPSTAPESITQPGIVAHENAEPASDALVSQSTNSSDVSNQHFGSFVPEVATARRSTDEQMATAPLSPVARQQWRELLTQAAATYTPPRSDSAASNMPAAKPLRVSPRDLDHTWF